MIAELSAFEPFREDLKGVGFHLCDVLPLDYLPDDIWLGQSALDGGSLLLIGHAGRDFWQAFKGANITGSDPVDHFSSQLTEQMLHRYFPEIPRQQLFPAEDCPVNLLALGRAFAWHHASPLGMGIHAEYGLWSAFRAVWWLESPDLPAVDMSSRKIPDVSQSGFKCSNTIISQGIIAQPENLKKPIPAAPDICAQCDSKVCISACPGEALDYKKTPDLSKCADYRLTKESACQSTCLARMACPYGAEHRYDTEQMSYHYDLALSAISEYRSKL